MAARTGSGDGERRFEVESDDGTPLAVWVDGAGPALVMVHGSMNDHTTFDPLVAALRRRMATYAMDRRGFGASGDGDVYAIEREFEDVAAVVEAVARRTGGQVALWGHSFGASCAMGGGVRTDSIHHLVLYEPSLGLTYPAGSLESIEAALAAGDYEAALLAVYGEVLEMPGQEIAAMRSGPHWQTRLASAVTVPREGWAEQGWVYQPGQFDSITALTLLLAGSESPPSVQEATRQAARALPGARVHVLEGHAHMAHKADPSRVAEVIAGFVT